MSVYEVHLGSLAPRPDRSRPAAQLPELAPAARRPRAERPASRTSSSCRSWSIRSTARGDIRSRGFFAPTRRYGDPAGSHVPDRPAAPGGHRRHPRLGAVALPERRASAWPISTARICTSTPIRASDSTRTGTASSSTTAAPRCAASWPHRREHWLDRYHVDGAARRRRGLHALPRLLAQSRASGSRIASAATRTSRRSTSCRQLNIGVYADHPDVQTIAEESTAWPGVSRPVDARRSRLRPQVGHGLDARHAAILRARPGPSPAPSQRAHLPRACTPSPRTSCCRSRTMRWSTARVRCSSKMPGDEWQQFANLRLLLGYSSPSRARSCCSWAASSGSGGVGPRLRSRLGVC